MTALPDTLKAFTDAAADVVARAIAGVQREAQRAEELRAAEHRAFMAEQREALAGMMRKVDERIAAVRDGLDGRDGALGQQGEPGVAGPAGQRGEKGDPGEAGRDGAPGEQGPPGQIGPAGEAGASGEAGGRGEVGPTGEQGATGERGQTGDPGPAGEKGDRGDDGASGSAGMDGKDAYPGEARGLFDPDATYRQMDVVSFNGSEWRAKQDDPGELPGEGWMLSASRGKRGDRGERGADGREGKSGRSTIAGYADARALQIVLTQDDGAELKIDMEEFARTIRDAATRA